MHLDIHYILCYINCYIGIVYLPLDDIKYIKLNLAAVI